MMRIAHILWDAQLGGIQKVVLDLCRAQAASGEVDPVVIFAKALGPLLGEFRTSGAKVHTLSIRSGYDMRPSNYSRLLSLLRETDAIHMHSYNPFIARTAVRSGIPVVYTEHGNFGFGRPLRAGERVNQWLQRRFLNSHVALITFNSEFSATVARERYGLEHVRSRIIPNGVDLDEVRIQAESGENQNKDGFVIGTTSRLAGGKRVLRLMEAFREFSKHPDTSLLIIGDGPERAMLEAFAAQHGLQGRIHFTGALNKPAVMQKGMDLCIYPFFNEAFGLVVVETYSLGKPALVFSDSGGLAEIVQGVSPEDVCPDIQHLIRRMEYWYNERSALTEFSDKARVYAGRYSIERMHIALLQAYQDALSD